MLKVVSIIMASIFGTITFHFSEGESILGVLGILLIIISTLGMVQLFRNSIKKYKNYPFLEMIVATLFALALYLITNRFDIDNDYLAQYAFIHLGVFSVIFVIFAIVDLSVLVVKEQKHQNLRSKYVSVVTDLCPYCGEEITVLHAIQNCPKCRKAIAIRDNKVVKL